VLDVELGELGAVTVGHDGSGAHPAWHLEAVEVKPIGDPIAFTGEWTKRWHCLKDLCQVFQL
jgi:hypothetical protein